jgi:2'-5' RNA ligase
MSQEVYDHSDEKRLFFGMDVAAPWPSTFPSGRLLEENHRHLTLAFLGKTSVSKLLEKISSLPSPPFLIGPTGKCENLLFLPTENPRVIAAEIEWLTEKETFFSYQKTLSNWLKAQHYPIDVRPFLPHLTIARPPFKLEEWKNLQLEIPFFLRAFHLYESLGHMIYEPLWTLPLLPPFEELDHMADLAFLIRAENLTDLHTHARVALAFKAPSLLRFLSKNKELHSLDEVIMDLNASIALMDQEIGSCFKAVSFHGNLNKGQHNLLEWEMIVDV